METLITVQDSGDGILPENIDRVFERFFQEKTRYEGVGVGLAICKAIVEAHGGRIWAESAGRGQGAIFGFALPPVNSDTVGS
jgi:signal transduction histidine kinase